MLRNAHFGMEKSRRTFFIEQMRKDKETIQRYKVFLGELQKHLYVNDAKEVATFLSITPASVYLKRKDPEKLKFGEQQRLAEKFSVDPTPMRDYLDLVLGIDIRIKQSSWKKLSLMQSLGMGAGRATLLTRNPLAWELYEVEKIIDLLITSEEI